MQHHKCQRPYGVRSVCAGNRWLGGCAYEGLYDVTAYFPPALPFCTGTSFSHAAIPLERRSDGFCASSGSVHCGDQTPGEQSAPRLVGRRGAEYMDSGGTDLCVCHPDNPFVQVHVGRRIFTAVDRANRRVVGSGRTGHPGVKLYITGAQHKRWYAPT